MSFYMRDDVELDEKDYHSRCATYHQDVDERATEPSSLASSLSTEDRELIENRRVVVVLDGATAGHDDDVTCQALPSAPVVNPLRRLDPELLGAVLGIAFAFCLIVLFHEGMKCDDVVYTPIRDLRGELTRVVETDIGTGAARHAKCRAGPTECLEHLRAVGNEAIYQDTTVLPPALFTEIFHGLRTKEAIFDWRSKRAS